MLRERDAVPVLIALLNDPAIRPRDLADIKGTLYRLGGSAPPMTEPGSDAEGHLPPVRTPGKPWWKDRGPRSTWPSLERHSATPFGYTLVVLLDKGKVMEVDAANKPRWSVSDLNYRSDAQQLAGRSPADRRAWRRDRVAERNNEGDILWQHKVDSPLVAQRLPNGNTVIANRELIVVWALFWPFRFNDTLALFFFSLAGFTDFLNEPHGAFAQAHHQFRHPDGTAGGQGPDLLGVCRLCRNDAFESGRAGQGVPRGW